PEDGARMTKGWFKVIPPNEDNTFDTDFTDGDGFDETDADDEDENWYYADSDGELYSGIIKKIKGKYYGFQPDNGDEGASSMLSGLVLIQVNEQGEITAVEDDGIDADELDDLLDGEYDDLLAEGYTLYYFGDSDNEDTDGAMKTGSTTITLDGDSYNFYFSKSGGSDTKGRGVTGIDDDKYIYKAGVKIKADSDDKYRPVSVVGNNDKSLVDINAENVTVTRYDNSDMRNGNAGDFATGSFRNDDDDTTRYVILYGEGFYLVNSSGTIQKNKTAAKDGDDWYYYVDNYEIKLYTNEKELTPDDGYEDDDPYYLDNWKNWDYDSNGEIDYGSRS
ncbi:MAG: hypothetical protein LUE65_11875, partial [Clostridiales bacterium]|nr:hypothetical protein [Clostridiales bacterium]